MFDTLFTDTRLDILQILISAIQEIDRIQQELNNSRKYPLTCMVFEVNNNWTFVYGNTANNSCE